MKVGKGTRLLLLGAVLVVIDQIIKILVKTNMSIGESFSVFGNWFQDSIQTRDIQDCSFGVRSSIIVSITGRYNL